MTSQTTALASIKPIAVSLSRVLEKLQEPLSRLPANVVLLVANYVTHFEFNRFGAAQWKQYYGVDVIDKEPELTKEFYKFWNGPDPLNNKLRVCDTHFPPILRPRVVVQISTNRSFDYCLNLLGELVQKPLEGHPSRFNSVTEALTQNGKIITREACWLVARKEVSDFSRGIPVAKQVAYMRQLNTNTQAGYEELPWALDLSTIIFVHHVVTSERYLGDATGVEKGVTLSRCKDVVKYNKETNNVVVGYHSVLGNRRPVPSGGLTVDGHVNFGYSLIGVMCVRKF